MKSPTQKKTIQATEISFKIIEEIRRRKVAGVSEIAAELSMSKSTVHEHLTTLVELGYLERVGSKYRIGLLFLTLGGQAREHEELYTVATDIVDDLAKETKERAKIVVEQNGKGMYLYQAQGPKSIRTDTHVGARVNLHSTAAGKAILAYYSPDEVEKFVDKHGLPAKTEETITDYDELKKELETIRENGIAFDDQERMEGIRCVAAPITRNEQILGSISVSGPKTRIHGETFRNDLAEKVADSARIINVILENY